MAHFFAKSIFHRAIALVLISIISFLMVHLAPGSPSQIDPTNPKLTKESIENYRRIFHLDKPLYVQYYLFYKEMFTGQLISTKDNQPVFGKIWERFLNSLPLFIVGTLITWTLSFPVGIRAAIRRGSAYDRSTTFLAYFLISIPGFFLAYILIIFTVNYLQIPVLGIRTFGMQEVGGLTAFMDRV